MCILMLLRDKSTAVKVVLSVLLHEKSILQCGNASFVLKGK